MKSITVKAVGVLCAEELLCGINTYGKNGMLQNRRGARIVAKREMERYWNPRLVDCTITITPRKGKK